jgi:hypothetical protein
MHHRFSAKKVEWHSAASLEISGVDSASVIECRSTFYSNEPVFIGQRMTANGSLEGFGTDFVGMDLNPGSDYRRTIAYLNSWSAEKRHTP